MHVSVTSNGKNEEKSAIIILSHIPVTNARITLASKPRSPTSSYKLRVNANPIRSRWISGTVPANELGTSAVSTGCPSHNKSGSFSVRPWHFAVPDPRIVSGEFHRRSTVYGLLAGPPFTPPLLAELLRLHYTTVSLLLVLSR